MTETKWLKCVNKGCLYGVLIPGLKLLFNEHKNFLELPIFICPKCFQEMRWSDD